MFGMDINVIAFVGLATLGVAGMIYGLFYNTVTNEANQQKRVSSIKQRDKTKSANAQNRLADAAKRRKTVSDSLKELEEKSNAKHNKKLTLKKMIFQAGLKISEKQFYLFSFLFAIFATLVAFIMGSKLLVVGGVFFVALLGLPRWIVGFIRKRRFKKFLFEFPNAVDVIVRGIRAGLPLNECINIIARESKEPVRTEFRRILEAQQLGLTMGDSIGKLYENVPLSEANFFAIVISIQQSAGGNLSEALSNLAAVLRERKKLDNKIKAMSSEAKASAGIIGSLPFIVSLLVYLTTPDYIMILFTHQTGNIILLCSAIWMSIGIMVMRSMINFDF